MDLVFNDTYEGPRFTYGLQYRPAAAYNIPDGRIIWADKPHPKFPRFGTVQYPRQLSEQEVKGFELVPVEEGN